MIAIPLGLYADHLHRLRRQDAAFERLVSKGATIFYSKNEGTNVSFMIRSEDGGIGATCWNDRVLYPDFDVPPSFSDTDFSLLEDIMELRSVNFWSSHVSDSAVRKFHHLHPRCSVSHNSLIYERPRGQ